MASSFKYFSENDRVIMSNQLTEEISANKIYTGGGIYAWNSQSNSPYYFTEIYSDSMILGAASAKDFDVTFGRSGQTPDNTVDSSFDPVKKNIYNQYSKVLLGLDSSGNPKKFNLDSEDESGSKVLHNAYFINFSRGKFKDRIKQGTFGLQMKVGSDEFTIADTGSDGKTIIREARTGYYGRLFISSSDADFSINDNNRTQGLIFYEAGIAVISPYIFSIYASANNNPSSSNEYIHTNALGARSAAAPNISGSNNIQFLTVSGTIQQEAYSLSNTILTASYNSITEVNSSIYFCRAYNNEFNYSSNPTYLSSSQIYVKGGDPEIPPRSYITTIGLYSDDNQLLAVAKLSEPVLKTPENELVARVRLDF